MMTSKKRLAEFRLFGPKVEDVIFGINESLNARIYNTRVNGSLFEKLERIQEETRWREDPLNLMPFLRLEGLRLGIADNLERLAEVLRGDM